MRRRDFIANRDYAPGRASKREGDLGADAKGDFGAAENLRQARAEEAGALDLEAAGGKGARRIGQGQRFVAARGSQEDLDPKARDERLPHRQVPEIDAGARLGMKAALEGGDLRAEDGERDEGKARAVVGRLEEHLGPSRGVADA